MPLPWEMRRQTLRINIASCPSLVLQDSGSVSKLHPWNSDCSVGLRGIGLLSLWLYVSSLDSQRGFYLPTEKVTNSMGVPLQHWDLNLGYYHLLMVCQASHRIYLRVRLNSICSMLRHRLISVLGIFLPLRKLWERIRDTNILMPSPCTCCSCTFCHLDLFSSLMETSSEHSPAW